MTYTILKRIGTGSFGTVFLIQSTENNKYYALKSINLDYTNFGDIRRQLHEINILFFNHCPYLLKGIDIYLKKTNTLELITPYYEGNTLDNFINTNRKLNKLISINIIWDIFFQLCLGIKYLHDNKIIHRDLKPANILLDNKIRPTKVIIIDFGASIILNKNNCDFTNTIIGTPYFMCPEQCDSKKYNNKCDIWALGCILYELITLEKPFVAQNISLLNYKISIGKYKEISNIYADQDIDVFKKIIRMCLDKNINNRASIYDIFNIHEMHIKIIKLNLNLKFKDLDIPIIINNKNITKNELINFIHSLRVYIQNNNQLAKSNENKLNVKIIQSEQLPIINKISQINKDCLQYSPKKNIVSPFINNKYSPFLPPINNNNLPPLNNNNNNNNNNLQPPNNNKYLLFLPPSNNNNLPPINNNNLPPINNNNLPPINNNKLTPINNNKLTPINNNKSEINSDEEKIEIYKLK
jgi:NIMA (never in mitosis gene a)-related kinase